MKRSVKTTLKSEKQRPTLVSDEVQEENGCLDLRGLAVDHLDRPLLLSPSLMIVVEKFNKLYRIAFEFLMSIAEPFNRSTYIHEY